jgi:surface antigen
MYHLKRLLKSYIKFQFTPQFQVKKPITVFLLAIILFANPVLALGLTPEQQSQLDDIASQIKAIETNVQKNKQDQQTIASEIVTIDAQTQIVQLKIEETQREIDIANSQIVELNIQIDIAEKELSRQKLVLNEYLRVMYINGQVSQIELILSSDNFSDFVNKSEYLDSMQQNVQEAISKIKSLTDKLARDKEDIEITKSKAESLQASQVTQRAALVAQQSYKQSLVDGIDAANAQLEKDKNALYYKKARLSRQFGESIISGSTSYPYGNPTSGDVSCPYNCTPDPWGYYIGQCTSYVAWKRAAIGKPIPPARGNGGEWTGAKAGYPQSDQPEYGDVMVFPYIGGDGHVAFVESVNSDGTVYISEYNWVENSYTERTVNPYLYSAFFIH